MHNMIKSVIRHHQHGKRMPERRNLRARNSSKTEFALIHPVYVFVLYSQLRAREDPIDQVISHIDF